MKNVNKILEKTEQEKAVNKNLISILILLLEMLFNIKYFVQEYFKN